MKGRTDTILITVVTIVPYCTVLLGRMPLLAILKIVAVNGQPATGTYVGRTRPIASRPYRSALDRGASGTTRIRTLKVRFIRLQIIENRRYARSHVSNKPPYQCLMSPIIGMYFSAR
jgi:hypothetical protein